MSIHTSSAAIVQMSLVFLAINKYLYRKNNVNQHNTYMYSSVCVCVCVCVCVGGECVVQVNKPSTCTMSSNIHVQ